MQVPETVIRKLAFFYVTSAYGFRRDSVVCNDFIYILLQLRNMTHDQTPKKVGFYGVISMYYAVACVDDSSGVGQGEIVLSFKNAVYGFSHDFGLTHYSY